MYDTFAVSKWPTGFHWASESNPLCSDLPALSIIPLGTEKGAVECQHENPHVINIFSCIYGSTLAVSDLHEPQI
jgi:hypothetical protein